MVHTCHNCSSFDICCIDDASWFSYFISCTLPSKKQNNSKFKVCASRTIRKWSSAACRHWKLINIERNSLWITLRNYFIRLTINITSCTTKNDNWWYYCRFNINSFHANCYCWASAKRCLSLILDLRYSPYRLSNCRRKCWKRETAFTCNWKRERKNQTFKNTSKRIITLRVNLNLAARVGYLGRDRVGKNQRGVKIKTSRGGKTKVRIRALETGRTWKVTSGRSRTYEKVIKRGSSFAVCFGWTYGRNITSWNQKVSKCQPARNKVDRQKI